MARLIGSLIVISARDNSIASYRKELAVLKENMLHTYMRPYKTHFEATA